MGRADDEDLADIDFLLQTHQVGGAEFRRAIGSAVVPAEYAELFEAAKPKVLGLLGKA